MGGFKWFSVHCSLFLILLCFSDKRYVCLCERESSARVRKTEPRRVFFLLFFFQYQGDAIVYILSVGDIFNLRGKTDLSGVRFHVHPGAAVILTPPRTDKR